ncbi:MAG: V-type ATPase subunit [Clostridia bacterium]|nr:V-type ATPase subunit [Clostridia bacterium]
MRATSASNSVLAKARAMYGQRLTAQNYNELLACRSVGEVAAYLKAQTAYSVVFEGVSMGALHRRQLEILVHDLLSMRFASLCRYEKFIGDKFYERFVMSSDIDLLLYAIRRINRAHPDDISKNVPDFFLRHSDIDAQKIRAVNDFDTLMSVVEGSQYKAILEPFASRGEGGSPDYFGMELALNKYFYSHGVELVKASYKGATRKELLETIAFIVDLENIVSIYRLKRLTDMPQTVLHTMLMPNGAMSEKTLGRILSAESADAALKALKGTPYEAFSQRNGESVEDIAGRLKYDYCKNKLRFSSKPSVVMLCYVKLAENEVQNITHIIEGIRYNIPAEEISRLLIGAGD